MASLSSAEYNRRYKLKHPNAWRDNSRRYRLQHPGRDAATSRRYRKNHPDRVVETLKRSRKKQLLWQKENPVLWKKLTREASLRAYHGKDAVEYFEKQNKRQHSLCAICMEPMRKPCLDHNHKTDRKRGILCDLCNRGIGFFKENTKSLQRAVE